MAEKIHGAMTLKKLFKILSLTKTATLYEWRDVQKLLPYIQSGEVIIVKKEWEDSWKQKKPEYYPLDLADIKTWSTYDKCVDLTYYLDGNGSVLKCKAVIYDGDNFQGYRKEKRFTAELIMPRAFIHEIEGRIKQDFEYYLEEKYEKYLEEQKQTWMKNLSDQILSNL